MIISCLEKNFIYIPISKVANTSILTAISRSTGNPRSNGYGHLMLVELYWNRITYEQLLESGLFKFAFVRNPWDRIVSCYNDKIFRWKSLRSESPHFGVPSNWDFARFVNWAVSLEKGDKFYHDSHFIPQHLLLYRDNSIVVDFIGRFERLSQDWRSISLRFGLSALPQQNMQSHAHYSSYFDQGTRAIVDRFYKRDAELFGYRFKDKQ